MERYNIENAKLIRGYTRVQGIITARNNPKKITGIQDLIRKDIRFINRNKGSGTRVLTDHLIRRLATKIGKPIDHLISEINGYNVEAKTHASIGAAIKLGRADMGIGVKTIANIYGLNFISLTEENFDFLIRENSIKREAVKNFIRTLKSKKFKEKLIEMEMRAPKDIGEIIWPKEGGQEK